MWSGLGTRSTTSTRTVWRRSVRSASPTPARRFNSAPPPMTGPMATRSKLLPTAISWCHCATRIGSSRSTTIPARAMGMSSGGFALSPANPAMWFSHQHDPRYEPLSTGRLMILDNGNIRRETDPKATSRGQVYQIDEQAKTATLVVNTDLARYSLALGSAEKLSNGKCWFDAGFLPDASGVADEFDSSGRSVFSIRTAAPVYRSYRLATMYSPVRGSR